MKIFVINLEKEEVKRNLVKHEFDNAGLSYELVKAINGKDLSEDELNKSVKNHQKNYLTKGEIGCALSHIFIYKKMVSENIPLALICEDDINLHKDTGLILEGLEKIANPGKKQAFLFFNSERKYANRRFDISQEYFFNECHGPRSTHGYVITIAAAKAMLSINYPLTMSADDWMHFYYLGHIKTYSINKGIITTYDDIDRLHSTLQADRVLLTKEKLEYRRKLAERNIIYFLSKKYHKLFRRLFLRKLKQ